MRTRLRSTNLCEACGAAFHPWSRTQKFCNTKCAARINNTTEKNTRIARATAAQRGDTQRGRGEGRTYTKRGGRHEHVVVAEMALGRALLLDEVVHHIDNDRKNNDPANLRVFASQADHARHHGELRRAQAV